jgi:hypothetical protein
MLMHVAWAQRTMQPRLEHMLICGEIVGNSTCWRIVTPPAHTFPEPRMPGRWDNHPPVGRPHAVPKVSSQSPRLFGRPSACLRRRKTWRCNDQGLKTQSCRDPKDSRERVHRCQTHRVPTFPEIAVRLAATVTHTCAKPIYGFLLAPQIKFTLTSDHKRGL